MFYFDKKVYYIDYYENGSRISNAGFISMVFKDEECQVHVGIRNLPEMESKPCRWFGLINSEQVFLEEFRIEGGRADFINSYPSKHMGKTDVDFSQLEGFYFALGKRRWGSCFFKNIRQNVEPALEEITQTTGTGMDKKESRDSGKVVSVKTQAAEIPEIPEERRQEDQQTEKTRQEDQPAEKEHAAPNPPVRRTTWEELVETHQIVHPFDDQGDYISINPFTLKMLAPEYRKLANNSFLLHGFYNYRHIILGYYQDEERQGYYIGVPGTYDEREQMVAEMFGFEGYEPAGGVGYYMRRVEF